MSEKTKVLIVDDSAIIRGLLEKTFREDSFFEVVASLSNGRKAVDFARENGGGVGLVVSDIDMPEMDGLAAAKILSGEMKIPVVIFSENASAKQSAFDAGAILFEVKPPLSGVKSIFLKQFAKKIKDKLSARNSFDQARSSHKTQMRQADIDLSEFAHNGRDSSNGRDTTGARNACNARASSAEKIASTNEAQNGMFSVLCLGASTGGPSAIQTVLKGLPENFPLPILYAQHIDIGSDEKMAQWFKLTCPNLQFHLAEDGMTAQPGHVYMSPADVHLVIDYVNSSGLPVLKLSHEPEEHFLRPAVNKLFRSASRFFKEGALAVLMTGMGRDGAEGCLQIVQGGGYTIAEDKSTCAVFGMPAAAIELNAAKEVLPRTQIASRLMELAGGSV